MAGAATEHAAIFEAMFLLARNIDRVHQTGVLRRKAGTELDRALHPVLITIGARQPLRIGDLADALALQSSTVSRHVARLEHLGLVEKDVADDRRACVLGLSPAGRRTLRSVTAAWETIIAETVAGVPRAELAAFATAFRRFAGELGSVPDRS